MEFSYLEARTLLPFFYADSRGQATDKHFCNVAYYAAVIRVRFSYEVRSTVSIVYHWKQYIKGKLTLKIERSISCYETVCSQLFTILEMRSCKHVFCLC